METNFKLHGFTEPVTSKNIVSLVFAVAVVPEKSLHDDEVVKKSHFSVCN